ncbi:unnamed protein product [Rotaria sp. Silwood2]|nr:unnamed protein product [Rotaria sp. Silwood2]CAF3402988.1 unnamed protein product [Rotaria sp. Silwood2]CAF3933780.1 unnamed protein product [Rotaria sp. Silwood2]CAF4343852.1 unnamed protein product [Rotaria sp. Silwood2]CAF4449361.1 unnamed protein product [Rotaria sp. Silwood2]
MKEENHMTFVSSEKVMATSQETSHDGLTDMTSQSNGSSYKIDHRDTNTLLSVILSGNTTFYVQAGSLVAMSP